MVYFDLLADTGGILYFGVILSVRKGVAGF